MGGGGGGSQAAEVAQGAEIPALIPINQVILVDSNDVVTVRSDCRNLCETHCVLRSVWKDVYNWYHLRPEQTAGKENAVIMLLLKMQKSRLRAKTSGG